MLPVERKFAVMKDDYPPFHKKCERGRVEDERPNPAGPGKIYGVWFPGGRYLHGSEDLFDIETKVVME